MAIPQEVGEAYPKWWCMGNCLYLLHLLPAYGSVNPLDQLIRDIRRFAAVSDVPLNIFSNPPMLVPADALLLQQEVLEKLLLRLEATFLERARDLWPIAIS